MECKAPTISASNILLGWFKSGPPPQFKRRFIMVDLQGFIEWQRAKPRRSVHIELGGVVDDDAVAIWVYDWNLKVGQIVSCVEEIDLERVKEEKERKLLEELKAKYEYESGGNTVVRKTE